MVTYVCMDLAMIYDACSQLQGVQVRAYYTYKKVFNNMVFVVGALTQ